jgi:PAS domain S-box-containing protein
LHRAGTDGPIVLVNPQTEKLFGSMREELLGHPVEVLGPDRFWLHRPAHRGNDMVNPQARAMGACNELYGLKKDGTEFPVEIRLRAPRNGRRRSGFPHDPRHHGTQAGA